jgi:hypothetical protein
MLGHIKKMICAFISYEAAQELRYQLTLITRADARRQAQCAPDQSLKFVSRMPIVIGDQRLRAAGRSNAAGVTTSTKCSGAFDLIASSIWLRQSRPPSRAAMSCQTERDRAG